MDKTRPCPRFNSPTINPRTGSLFAAALLLLANVTLSGERLWSDNKLTPDQPFPGRVCAVEIMWTGNVLMIEEIGGERLCLAHILVTFTKNVKYTILDPAKGQTKEDPYPDMPDEEKKKVNRTYLSPGVEVDRFSWSIGPHRFGKIFGDDDLLRKVMEK